MRKILVTGSAGLIGSEVCLYFSKLGWKIFGLDNNKRSDFFGPAGDTKWNLERLGKEIPNYEHYSVDIRDRNKILDLIPTIRPDAIVHAAAQPSHDKAASIPFDDFDINSVGTFNLLEATKRFNKDIPFIHFSTNKVYGDSPNKLKLRELETRFEFDDINFLNGIHETFTIDQSTHSLFGASKLAADIAVQEYGRYFNMPTVALRGGCLTGPNHSGVELHGFLSFLIKCNLSNHNYKIMGYKGKQVRDNIHSIDIASFIDEFIKNPRSGEVYNIGGGKENTCSIIEAFELISSLSGKNMNHSYCESNRQGDHICYYSDLSKIKKHYPNWTIKKDLKQIFQDIFISWMNR